MPRRSNNDQYLTIGIMTLFGSDGAIYRLAPPNNFYDIVIFDSYFFLPIFNCKLPFSSDFKIYGCIYKTLQLLRSPKLHWLTSRLSPGPLTLPPPSNTKVWIETLILISVPYSATLIGAPHLTVVACGTMRKERGGGGGGGWGHLLRYAYSMSIVRPSVSD